MDTSFLAFIAIATVVLVTPGQDTALTIRNTLVGGRPSGVATAAGVAGGQLVWTVAAAAGMTAVLVASEPVFTAIRLAGSAYLIYLGATTLWAAWRGQAHDHNVTGASPGRSTRRALRQGFVSNLGNPKMVIFFSSLLPPFAPAGIPPFLGMLTLGVVFVLMTVTWLSAYAWVVARAGAVLQRPRIRRWLDTAMGIVLVALGLRIAAEPVLVDR